MLLESAPRDEVSSLPPESRPDHWNPHPDSYRQVRGLLSGEISQEPWIDRNKPEMVTLFEGLKPWQEIFTAIDTCRSLPELKKMNEWVRSMGLAPLYTAADRQTVVIDSSSLSHRSQAKLTLTGEESGLEKTWKEFWNESVVQKQMRQPEELWRQPTVGEAQLHSQYQHLGDLIKASGTNFPPDLLQSVQTFKRKLENLPQDITGQRFDDPLEAILARVASAKSGDDLIPVLAQEAFARLRERSAVLEGMAQVEQQQERVLQIAVAELFREHGQRPHIRLLQELAFYQETGVLKPGTQSDSPALKEVLDSLFIFPEEPGATPVLDDKQKAQEWLNLTILFNNKLDHVDDQSLNNYAPTPAQQLTADWIYGTVQMGENIWDAAYRQAKKRVVTETSGQKPALETPPVRISHGENYEFKSGEWWQLRVNPNDAIGYTFIRVEGPDAPILPDTGYGSSTARFDALITERIRGNNEKDRRQCVLDMARKLGIEQVQDMLTGPEDKMWAVLYDELRWFKDWLSKHCQDRTILNMLQKDNALTEIFQYDFSPDGFFPIMTNQKSIFKRTPAALRLSYKTYGPEADNTQRAVRLMKLARLLGTVALAPYERVVQQLQEAGFPGQYDTAFHEQARKLVLFFATKESQLLAGARERRLAQPESLRDLQDAQEAFMLGLYD